MRSRILVIASNYKQFQYWCNSQGFSPHLQMRNLKYVSSEEMTRGYTPDETSIMVLSGLPLEDWKYDKIKELEALGFDINYDTT